MLKINESKEFLLRTRKNLWFHTVALPGDTDLANNSTEIHSQKCGMEYQVISHLQPGS